ncbi:MAG TPA: MFS transporter [Caldithrix abyssi]|uniref:MFS transporter n=1 Tax=Caldithrix abyssi TaxID=187145 RepID=A0A7V1LN36_CALAY|nr:MFS transporter [Caldithrix abyssi]
MKETNGRTSWPNEKRNIIAGIWHGTFFKFGSAFSQENSILPSFIYSLTGSQILVGLLSTIQRIGVVAPQLLLAHFLSRRPCKKKYLVGAIYLRSLVWFIMGFVVWFLADSNPGLTVILAFGLLMLFFMAGSMGQLVYSYLLSTTVSPERRGRFFGLNNLTGGLAGILAGWLARELLSRTSETALHGYGLLFLVTAAAFAVAGLGFIYMRETRLSDFKPAPALSAYLRQSLGIVRENSLFRRVLLVSVFNASVFIILPFFVVLARQQLQASDAEIGFFVMMQVAGEMAGGMLWGAVADRYGYRRVLIGVATVYSGLPLYATWAAHYMPALYLITFFLMGAVLKSSENAVRNYLLEMTTPQKVPTFIALKNTISAPTLFYPLLGGLLTGYLGYYTVFGAVALLSAAGLFLALRLPEPREKTA